MYLREPAHNVTLPCLHIRESQGIDHLHHDQPPANRLSAHYLTFSTGRRGTWLHERPEV